uniref:ATP synthase F0 subunit 8 n=1 Tax=Hemisphaerius rufovarius TaxID=1897809 RepID=A0A6M4AFQ7_9HEMI|nr:ATP synthase F0 subunit 8 [Hemisphaerius rufovarius]
MPQMSPLNWMMSIMMILTMMYYMNSTLYFDSNKLKNKLKNKKKNKKMNWMW